MITIDTILTHPGGAHKDEFLACSVLLALHAVPIVRREPLPADLAAPTTAVIDVGDTHDPTRNNFDHHQFAKDHPPTCSLSLVLQHLGIYDDARRFCDWLETTEWFDSRGPIATARWLGVTPEILSQLNSPLDLSLLRRFGSVARIAPGEPLWETMRWIGRDLLEYVQSMRARLDFIGEHAQFWDLDLAGTPAKVLFLPRTEPMPEEPSQGTDPFIESSGFAPQVAGVIYPDRRGPGYGLSRFRDDPRFNFAQLAHFPDVHFAHARGFVAKTSATDLGRLKQLLTAATVAAPSAPPAAVATVNP